MKVCYAVASSGWDRHTQMTWVSAQSVRYQEPDAHIVVIFEGPDAAAGDDIRRRFAGVANEVVLQCTTEPNPVYKSRIHRISLREYVPGDFLYLDSDTLAVAPLRAVFDADGDVGAVIDCNNDMASGRFPPEFEEPFSQLGWTYPLPHYLNSGVILMRDRPSVHLFCKEWMKRWKAQEDTSLTLYRDQACFNSAFFASEVKRVILPHRYNTMVVKRNYPARNGCILHFFGSAEEQRGTLIEHLLMHLAGTGEFDQHTYLRSIREGHHWGPAPEPWQLRFSGNYLRAAIASIRRAVGSSRRLEHP